jgi:Protein of unknown function (DUF3305)
MTARVALMTVGVVVERRPLDNWWRKWRWRVVEVVPGLAARDWRLLVEGPGVARFVAGGQVLELHPKATADYKLALSASPPQLYVVLRPEEQQPVPFRPFLVTASPWEAQAYQESGEDLIEAVPMPKPIAAWLDEFVADHHVDEPFYKRQRKGMDKNAADGSDFVRLGDRHAG